MENVFERNRHPWAPAAALLLLSPLIVEVLFGATHLTTLYLLIPQVCIYGGGALIIRELVRRTQRSWGAILLMGIAFAILEECVILQTSVSPALFGGDPGHIYGWASGVSWVYLLWALGYESVWAILLPIQLAEVIFPTERTRSWIGLRRLVIAAVAFVLASAAVWYRFTQVGIAPGMAYQAPFPVVVVALLVAGACVAAAFAPWNSPRQVQLTIRGAPRPWLAGLVAFLLSLLWFMLPALIYAGPVPFPPSLPIAIGLTWAAGALLLVRRWSAGRGWSDSHRLALITGALLASMLAGFVESGIQLPVDLVGKLVFNLIAVLLLFSEARGIQRRESQDSF